MKAAGKLVIGYWTRPIIYYQKQNSQLETDFAVFIQLTIISAVAVVGRLF
jgi:hypothetical protein